MRKLVFVIILILSGVLVSLIGLGLAISEIAPLHTDNLLFPVQHYSEMGRLWLFPSNTDKAGYALTLIDRRAGDLARFAGTPYEIPALLALNDAIDQAQRMISGAPESDRNLLVKRMETKAKDVYTLLRAIQVTVQELSDIFYQVEAKVSSIQQLNAEPKVSSDQNLRKARNILLLPQVLLGFDPALSNGDASIAAHLIQFPAGSAGAEHAFFPLLGVHAQISCEQCHISGQFSGTSSQCEACHASVKPVSHYAGDCAACHTSVSWKDINFDHTLAGATNCQSCHAADKPANHFQGQCSACHTTRVWRPATFNHQAAGATDCQSCHTRNKPANHFNGQCSLCHNTGSWQKAIFNHEAMGATDCQSCHSSDKPANHFDGQCSSCHTTGSWKGGGFNHEAMAATDCQSCHTRPDNHYGGQCSACHNTSAWGQASFSHEGQTDCQSCHTRPDNHYGGQCSACHNTSAWGQASFSHDGQTDCQSCHTRPANHWGGQCSACHSTQSWGGVQVSNHSFPIDHKNADGVCSRCHPANNSNWTCYNCHNQAETEKHHAEKNIFDIGNRCIECHPSGDD